MTTETVTHPVDGPTRLVLSGGGFRATLFHLGVVTYLRDQKKLKQIEEIYSVSGGSILAGHMACRWEDYCGEHRQFSDAANELVAFTMRGVREAIVRRYLLFIAMPLTAIVVIGTILRELLDLNVTYSAVAFALLAFVATILLFACDRRCRPIALLERAYMALYKGASLESIKNRQPEFFFLATNLRTAQPAYFTNSGFSLGTAKEGAFGEKMSITKDVPLARCVAASSAFPPLFSPVLIDPRSLKIENWKLSEVQSLADGGVYDNLGLDAARALSTASGPLLVSNAECRLDWASGHWFRLLLPRAIRSTDILMSRVSALQAGTLRMDDRHESSARLTQDERVVRLQDELPEAESGSAALSPEFALRARQIRTDLDAFLPSEVLVLFCLGYAAARNTYEGRADLGDGVHLGTNGMPIGCPEDRWLPVQGHPSLAVASIIDSFSASDRQRTKVWKTTSPVAWFLLVCACAVMLCNPLTLHFMRRLPATPRPFAMKELTPMASVPTFFSFLMTFLPRGDSATPRGVPYMLKSDSLSRYTPFGRDPAAFSFSLQSPRDVKVSFRQAFVYYPRSMSWSLLNPLSTDEAGEYEVDTLNGDAEIIVLLEIAPSNSALPDLEASEFRVTTK